MFVRLVETRRPEYGAKQVDLFLYFGVRSNIVFVPQIFDFRTLRFEFGGAWCEVSIKTPLSMESTGAIVVQLCELFGDRSPLLN